MPGFIGQYGLVMSAVKSAGSMLTGSAPVGSLDPAGGLLAGGLLAGGLTDEWQKVRSCLRSLRRPTWPQVSSGHACRGFMMSSSPSLSPREPDNGGDEKAVKPLTTQGLSSIRRIGAIFYCSDRSKPEVTWAREPAS